MEFSGDLDNPKGVSLELLGIRPRQTHVLTVPCFVPIRLMSKWHNDRQLIPHYTFVGVPPDMRDCLARHGLAEGRFVVLEQLMNASEPMSHTQLAEQVGVTKASVTGLVDALERDGYLQREPSLGDRRVCYISITKSGQEIAHSVAPELGKCVLGLFSGLSPDEQNLLSQLLRHLRTKEGSDVESI